MKILQALFFIFFLFAILIFTIFMIKSKLESDKIMHDIAKLEGKKYLSGLGIFIDDINKNGDE